MIFSLAIAAILFISGCESYLNQGAVGSNVPGVVDCTLPQNAVNPECTPETFDDSQIDFFGGGAFSAQDRVLATLDLEQARMDALAEKGQLAYVPSQNRYTLTRQTIKEINGLIGLPENAGAAEREAWYAEWAEKEDKKFAAAIARGTEKQIAAEYDKRIQELEDQSKLAAAGDDTTAVAQALVAADKAAALKKEQDIVKTFSIIINLPDNPKAQTPAQNNGLKQMAAQVIIQAFADRNGDGDGRVTKEEVKAALKAMDGFSGLMADRYLGNKDGKVDIEEIEKMNAVMTTEPGLPGYNPGLRVFFSMILQYQ